VLRKKKKKEIDGRRGDELDLREDGKGKGVGACLCVGGVLECARDAVEVTMTRVNDSSFFFLF